MNRLVWFRNDLRLSDNATLQGALTGEFDSLMFIFIYDEKWDLATPEDTPRTGPFRKKFLAETVDELRRKLRSLGADLNCLYGNPVELVPEVCRRLQIKQVFHSRTTSFDERVEELDISRRLKLEGVETFSFQTQTLICDEDIRDFDLYQKMSFSKLRNFIEKDWPVRKPLPMVEKLESALRSDLLSTFKEWDYGLALAHPKPSFGISMTGGESAAFARLKDYIWDGDCLRNYRNTRNGLIHRNDSAKLSPALAVGCLSLRTIYQEVRRYESERVSNESTLWFLYELLWRDHFHFAARARGKKLFTDTSKVLKPSLNRNHSRHAFESWLNGRTGNSFIDAAMNELRMTGWLSNRMRQNAASYLVHELGVDWKVGARWFESCLVDYDPCSNWGNWSYIAGAGDWHQPHIFDVAQQQKAYDPDGEYSKLWAITKS